MRAPAFKRSDRLAGEVRDIVTVLLREKIHDPRLKGVYITRVEIPKDLHVAVIGWHFMTDPKPLRITEAERGFKSASGLFAAAIARALRVKRMPEVEFRYDKAIEAERRIEELLAGAAASAAVMSSPIGISAAPDDDASGESDPS